MKDQPKAKMIEIENNDQGYTRILGGPPESLNMRSGLVVLEPQQSVGRHSTGPFEEMVVVMEGAGEMVLGDGTSLTLDTRHVCYCPPETEHDVINRGNTALRYVYIVARVK